MRAGVRGSVNAWGYRCVNRCAGSGMFRGGEGKEGEGGGGEAMEFGAGERGVKM